MADDKRNKILLAILGAMLIVAAITAGALVAVTRDANTVPHAQDPVASGPVSSADVPVIRAPESTDEVPEQNASWMDRISEQDRAEYNSAYMAHWSDTLFVTLDKCETENECIYWLVHIIMRDPDQIRVALPGDRFCSERVTLPRYAQENDFVVGINASTLDNGNTSIIDGLYIKDGVVLQGTHTTGVEMCIGADGSLFAPPAGTSADDVLFAGAVNSVLSYGPTIIMEQEPVSLREENNLGTKTVIACKGPREYYLVVASDGDYISGVSYSYVQEILLERGCQFAKAMSDSANVSLVMDGEAINEPAAYGDFRGLFDFILFTD